MKFIRLTSVFLCCTLLSFFMVLPASASDDDNYYSLAAVSTPEPSTFSLSSAPFAIDRDYTYVLNNIATNTGTTNTILQNIISYVQGIANNVGNLELSVDSIYKSLGSLASEHTLQAILSAVNGIDGYATETTLKAFSDSFSSFAPFNSEWPGESISFGSYFSKLFGVTGNPAMIGDFISDSEKGFIFNVWANPVEDSISSRFSAHVSWSGFISSLLADLVFDGNQSSYMGGGPTLYRMIHLLQDTLASEDDRKLADNYKDNRHQAETDFLTGQSGKTSLGKNDFGSLSSVGGTFNDAVSLNGQSSITDLTSGLSDADTAGQGWFSQATKDSLDAVSSSGSSDTSVSTFSNHGSYSVDVDPDPYHMQGFENNYAWLWGDD